MILPFYKHFSIWIVLLFGLVSLSVEINSTWSDSSREPVNRTVLNLINELDGKVRFSARKDLPVEMRTARISNAIRLIDSKRLPVVRDTAVSKVVQLLRKHKRDFIFSFKFFQKEGNVGVILSLFANDSYQFQIESEGRYKEIKLIYTSRGKIHEEKLPYNLADEKWHNVVVKVKAKAIYIFVDCLLLEKRMTNIVDIPPMSKKYTLYLGQRHDGGILLKGALRTVKLVTPGRRLRPKCFRNDADSSKCANLQTINQEIKKTLKRNNQLFRELNVAKAKLMRYKNFTCEKNCKINSTAIAAGEQWTGGHCVQCRCRDGNVTCQLETDYDVKCAWTMCRDKNCCIENCGDCLYDSRYYIHGDVITPRRCLRCECWRHRMICEEQYVEKDCPKLDCAESDRVSVEGECCPVCKPTGHCGHIRCHEFATCVNLPTGKECRCKKGFVGNGVNCTDFDECRSVKMGTQHRCEDSSKCFNTPGSYYCKCLGGYSRVDIYSPCTDINECLTSDTKKRHACGGTAICVNLIGYYHCMCKEGDRRINYNICQGMFRMTVSHNVSRVDSRKTKDRKIFQEIHRSLHSIDGKNATYPHEENPMVHINVTVVRKGYGCAAPNRTELVLPRDKVRGKVMPFIWQDRMDALVRVTFDIAIELLIINT